MEGIDDVVSFLDLRNIPSIAGIPGVRGSPSTRLSGFSNTASSDIHSVLGYVLLAREPSLEFVLGSRKISAPMAPRNRDGPACNEVRSWEIKVTD